MSGKAIKSANKKNLLDHHKTAKAAEKRARRLDKRDRNIEGNGISDTSQSYLSPEHVNIEIDSTGRVVVKEQHQTPGRREK